MKLDALIDRLADFTPTTSPVISLYLDGRPDQHGREHYSVFVRKELAMRSREWPMRSSERDSFHRDVDRILTWLHEEARPSANGFALFACAGAGDFFEAVQLDAPIEEHALFVGAAPRLGPLVRLAARYRRYVAVVVDSHAARIFVLGLGEVEASSEIEGEKTRRSDAGGWSPARFQRHVDHQVTQHLKDVVESLDEITRTEGIGHVVIAGDDSAVALLRAELPKPLEEKVVDVIRLEMTASEPEIMARTLVAMRAAIAREDAAAVTETLDAQRAGGLGAAGIEAVRAALENGQVHELLISTDLAAKEHEVVEELVTRARRTSAVVRFVDDRSLLESVGGVAARLRYQIGGKAA